ncbi:MAG: teichuronic acid biosynthesis glycosyltransferase TuaG [Candidatus Azotimanducaceae bacterium]
MQEGPQTVQVSVIMPAYNAARYIGESIDSVLGQSYIGWELIVINDASTDGTQQVVERYVALDDRIKLLNLPENHGAPAGPRNNGIAQAAGKWIAFLDSDDLWHPEKLTVQMKALQDSGAKFCSAMMNDFHDSATIVIDDVGVPTMETITFYRQLVRYRTPTSSVVIEREILLSLPFNEDMRFKAREDYDLWLRVHESIRESVKVMTPLVYYRVSEGQISGSKWTMLKRTLLVLQEYRFIDGSQLGWKSYLYTGTHVLFSLYYRIILKSL